MQALSAKQGTIDVVETSMEAMVVFQVAVCSLLKHTPAHSPAHLSHSHFFTIPGFE